MQEVPHSLGGNNQVAVVPKPSCGIHLQQNGFNCQPNIWTRLRITPNKKGKEKYILIICQMKKRKNATHNEEFLWTGSCIQGLKKPSLEEVCGFHIIREIDG